MSSEEPLLFHCGPRGLFPSVSGAAARVMPLETLRWIGFGHVEADECGSMNQWLAAAPNATVVHGLTGCMVSIEDLADRPPRALTDGTVLELGEKRVRYIDTPHVPHGWEACVLYEETTGTLFSSDLFTHGGDPAPLTEGDITDAAIQAERAFGFTPITAGTGATMRRLAALRPKTIAVMHGSSFSGDGAAQLGRLAAFYDERLAGGAATARG